MNSYTPSLQSSEDSNLVYLPLIQTESNKMTINYHSMQMIMQVHCRTNSDPYNVGEQVTLQQLSASPGYIFHWLERGYCKEQQTQ